MSKLKRERLNAVFDDDLLSLLGDLGILAKFEHGELKCKFCRVSIAHSNLSSLFKQSGEIKLVCDKQECLQELYTLLRTGEVSL